MSNTSILLKKSEIQPGEVKRVEANGTFLAVYNLSGEFYVTNDCCTHATASLSEGEIVDDDLIACPVHDGTFHIPSGQAVGFPCEIDLRTYKVIDDAENVVIDWDQEADEAASAI